MTTNTEIVTTHSPQIRTVAFPRHDPKILLIGDEPDYFLSVFRDAHVHKVEFAARELRRVEGQISSMEGAVSRLAERGEATSEEYQSLCVKRAQHRTTLKKAMFWYRAILDGVRADEIDIAKNPALWREFEGLFNDILSDIPCLLIAWSKSKLTIYDLAQTLLYENYEKTEPPKRAKSTRSRSTKR